EEGDVLHPQVASEETINLMTPLASTVMIVSLIAHGLLLIYVQTQRPRLRTGRWWVTLAILFSFLTGMIYLNPALGKLDGYLVVVAQTTVLIAYGALVIQDVTNRRPRWWLIGGGLWFAVLIAAGAFGDASALSQTDWLVNLFRTPSAAGVVAVLGVIV